MARVLGAAPRGLLLCTDRKLRAVRNGDVLPLWHSPQHSWFASQMSLGRATAFSAPSSTRSGRQTEIWFGDLNFPIPALRPVLQEAVRTEVAKQKTLISTDVLAPICYLQHQWK